MVNTHCLGRPIIIRRHFQTLHIQLIVLGHISENINFKLLKCPFIHENRLMANIICSIPRTTGNNNIYFLYIPTFYFRYFAFGVNVL